MTTFYNKLGVALAYISDDNQYIYLYNGTPVAWLSDENIYAYSGRYLGWIVNGVAYDRNGNAAFFTENSSGGPVKPPRAPRPPRGPRGPRPPRGAREPRPPRPARSLSWSHLSNEKYFTQ
ncbi:MAG TPA: hypothetical protein VKG26_13705 [Bacteroidia bacterium]|nr:hypothetical protein [Bacteroidia bacterium]